MNQKNVNNRAIVIQIACVLATVLINTFLIVNLSVAIFSFFILMVVFIIFSKTTQRSFLKFQKILPTSKIRSLSMGLVEIEGKVNAITPVYSKLGDKKCIAYEYTLSRRKMDQNNTKTYEIIDKKSEMNDFTITDDTGTVEVSAADLDCVWLSEYGSYNQGDLYYKQTILFAEEEVLLIGKAVSDNNKIRIEKDEINDVFNLTRSKSINFWNTYKPLLTSLYLFGGLSVLMWGFVSFVSISISDSAVHFLIN